MEREWNLDSKKDNSSLQKKGPMRFHLTNVRQMGTILVDRASTSLTETQPDKELATHIADSGMRMFASSEIIGD